MKRTNLYNRTLIHTVISLSVLTMLLSGSRAQTAGIQEAGFGSGAGAATIATPVKPVKPQTCREELPGNGTDAGYMLSHGNIVPDSIRVTENGLPLINGTDYTVDCATGSIYFSHPILRFDTIGVTYTYDAASPAATATPLGILALNVAGASMNFGAGLTSVNSQTFNTYGMNINSKLGSGGLNSMVYFSTPGMNSRNMVQEGFAPTQPAMLKQLAPNAKSDHLILQNLNLNAGAAFFHANFQDVGSNFAGYNMLQGGSTPQSQLAALEKEKGIQRLGFGGGLKMTGGGAMSFDWNTVHDRTGQILQQSVGYAGKAFHVNMSNQMVGNTFNAFGNLSDTNAAQLALEKGVSRNNISLGFGSDKSSYLNFNRSTMGDAAGALAQQNIQYGSKGFKVNYFESQAGASFNRFTSMTDAEKSDLALAIHQQFDPNAAANSVTPMDKNQLANDSGLSRSLMSVQTALGKKGAMILNFANIGDSTGGVMRNSMDINLANLTVNYMDQHISQGFNRLASLDNFEKAQLGNEAGMHTANLGMKLALNKTSSLNFNNLNIGDSQSGLTRQSLDYNAKNFQLGLKMASTDANFTRARDLGGMTPAEIQDVEAERGFHRLDLNTQWTIGKGSTLTLNRISLQGNNNGLQRNDLHYTAQGLDVQFGTSNVSPHFIQAMGLSGITEAEKQSIASEVGFNRYNFGLNYSRIKNLNISSSLYNADDPTADMSKSIWNHSLNWTNGPAMHISLLSEGNNFFEHSKVQTGDVHNLINLDIHPAKTMELNISQEQLNQGSNGVWNDQNTSNILYNWQAGPKFNLNSAFAMVNTNNGTSQLAHFIKIDSMVSKALTLNVNQGNTWDQNTGAIINSEGFGASSPVGRDLNMSCNYALIRQTNQPINKVLDYSLGNAKPMNILGLKNVVISANMATSINSGHQTNQTGGKISGMFLKNQISLDYGGTLNANNTGLVSRSLEFTSDPNQKLPLHMHILYRSMNVNFGELILSRAYSADYKLGALTSLSWNYTTMPSTPAGIVQQTKASTFAFNQQLNKALKMNINYTTAQNLTLKSGTNMFGGNLQGNLDKLSSIQVGYNVDLNHQVVGQPADTQNFQLAYDTKLSSGNSLTLSTNYMMNRATSYYNFQTNVAYSTTF